MNSGISKVQARRYSRVKQPKAIQETLLDAVAGTGAKLRQSYQEQSLLDAAAVRATKRQLDEPSEDLLPAKRSRLTQTDEVQHRVEDEEAEQVAKTVLQQPKPNTLNCRYPSFLEDFINPLPESSSTFVSKWLESVGSDQERRCRSDSYLQPSQDNPVSRNLTRSAPGMSYTRDPDGFMLPPTPASTESRLYRVDTDARSVALSDISSQSSGSRLVENPLYRSRNLATNNVYMRKPHEAFPECISSLVDMIRKDRSSPVPLLDQIEQDTELVALEMGTGELDVEQYFRTHFFPYPKSTECLKRADRQPMSKHAVPNTGTMFKVSNPVPDMLYGYNNEALPQQQAELMSIGMANSLGVMYPFFAIEFKGDGPGGAGGLWVPTNQCLGDSTSCVRIAELLNDKLRKCKRDKIRPTDSAAFSIATNGTEARLYISWKHNELYYYMQRIDGFLLYDPEQYLKFRKYVWNIIDWGKGKRLNEIRESLDCLLEESRKRTSVTAKSRQPHSDGFTTSGGKKPKSSLLRTNSSRSSNAQGQSHRANELYLGPYKDPSSYPCQEQSFVNTDNIDEGSALPSYFYLEEDQQDQIVSFDSSTEAPASFATKFHFELQHLQQRQRGSF